MPEDVQRQWWWWWWWPPERWWRWWQGTQHGPGHQHQQEEAEGQSEPGEQGGQEGSRGRGHRRGQERWVDSAPMARRHVCYDSILNVWLPGITLASQMGRCLNPLDFYLTHPSAGEPIESVCGGGAKLKMWSVQPSVRQLGQRFVQSLWFFLRCRTAAASDPAWLAVMLHGHLLPVSSATALCSNFMFFWNKMLSSRDRLETPTVENWQDQAGDGLASSVILLLAFKFTACQKKQKTGRLLIIQLDGH